MDIRVSPKHGLNPSMGICILCLQEDGTIVLPGMLAGDEEAPRRAVWSRDPCDNCKEMMKIGVILISIDDKKTKDENDPYRTGGWVVVREAAIHRIFPAGEKRDRLLEERAGYLTDEVWDAIKLPRGPVDGVPGTVEEFKKGAKS